ncbi:MAG: monovalent cation/H+ antiporter subunit D family protein, partial [Desulfocapsaceae bacterium]
MMPSETMLLFTILVPLAAVIGIVGVGRYPNLREAVSLTAALVLIYLTYSLYRLTESGVAVSWEGLQILPGLPLFFNIEPLGMLFSLIGSFLWLITTLYAIGYMRGHQEENQTRFYACFAIAISSVMGIAYAGNLFTLFIFYEILTLSTYPL